MGKSTQELKYKRLKVGHACYVCRSKKIKCDGLRPCMQCKARGRNCQSSNSETSTQQYENNSNTINTTPTENGFSDDNSSHRSQAESDDDSILFFTPHTSTMADSNVSMAKYNESWTSNVVIEASEDFKNQKNNPNGFGAYPAFGTFVRWRDEPPLPTKYTHPIEMPSSHIQMHLIDLFFKTRYKVAPMFPKRLFYEQLRIKGPLITPFLLNSIYCTVSGYSTLSDVSKPAVFYNRAKKMLDDFLDTPRVSTVAALCLLALYEPLPIKSKNIPDQHCRSWMYSGMASRMCLELGLNIDTPRAHANKSPEEIELCRRVFWSCYCLDKMQSAEWERLWSIPASLARTAFPQLLPGDDEEERGIVMTYEEKIRLSLIGEEGLQIRASFSIRKDIQDEHYFSQLEEHRLKLLKWRSNLKSPELWGLSHCDTVDQVIHEPKKSPVMSYLHIIYYFMLVDTLFCLPDSDKRSLEHRIYASQLTKSIDTICDEPSVVIRYEFLAHAAIASIRVHGRYINSPDQEVARQSWIFFHQCVKILKKFQKYAILPECSAILANLPALCQDFSKPPANSSTHMVQALPTVTENGTKDFSSIEYNDKDSYIQESNLPQVPSHHQQPQSQEIDLQQDQVLYDNSSAIPSYDFQSLDSMVIPQAASSLGRPSALGSSIGVDFGDRRQLWEHALQDVLNESNQYDINSSATTPESITTPLIYNNDWSSSTSPRATSDFIWPTTTEPSQQHSPPSLMQQIQHMISSPLQQQQQQYEQHQFQQIHQPSYSLSSSPHHHQHDMNTTTMMYAPYSTHPITQPYVQQPHYQIPSSSLPYNMHNHLTHSNMPLHQAYYPN